MRYLIVIFLFIFSCRELPEQINSSYQGNWYGVYDGVEKGTLDFEITNEGNISGIKVSTSNNYTEEFLGYVFADGQFSCNTRKGFIFKGKFSGNGATNFSGEWIQNVGSNTYKGTFKFIKK